MAERPEGFGFTAEIHGKIAGKYDPRLEQEAINWINHYVPDSGLAGKSGPEALHEALSSGVVLCKLMNALQPGSIPRINESKMAFKKMENIGNFLDACSSRMNVNKTDLFQTVDLYESTNMPQVINAIHALGRKAQAMGKFGIGPKESHENKRHFSEEQLRAGDGVIGLQAGTNKYASQSGQNFGKTRAIMD